MKSFVVIGMGRFGSNLARTLSSLGYEVLAHDEDAERIQKISDHVTHAVVGNAGDDDVLRAIGVRNFDCTVVAVSDDLQASVLITLMLKEMGVKYVVAKAQSDQHAKLLSKIGADKIVFPEKDMGMKVAQSLAMNNILDYIELSDSYSIVEVMVPKKWAGKTLRELNVRSQYGINVMAVRHHTTNEIEVSPGPDDVLSGEDAIVVIGSNMDIGKINTNE
jgi:trk system potassium uptake protein TrkA